MLKGEGQVKIHLLGLAHTVTNRAYMACAYTQKVLKLAQMLTDLGYEVIHYGAESSCVPCDHVTVITSEDQRKTYGDYDWRSEFFRHDPKDAAYTVFNGNAVREINRRKGPRDILLVPFGNYQEPIAKAVEIPLTVEMGIGYEGVFADFRVFESYAWMHHVYGKRREEARYYDAVIPNYFDLSDFTYSDKSHGYLAYIGRLIPRKGVQIAIDVARTLDKPLLMAGQGSLDTFNTEGADVQHLGCLGPEQRDRFLGGAEAVLVPTQYIEPFGGVAVEAQLCGTPVITTDWGAFTETVRHGETGYRCRTMDDFVWATTNAPLLDRRAIRRWASENYSMERVGRMYDEYLRKLQDLYADGWYAQHPDRTNLEWMQRFYG
jgi:glycosyltransferase involved in cell wall biosynthesis